MCLQIWGTESETWLQTLHFFFAFGATLAPLIAKPFINEVSYHEEVENSTSVSNASSLKFLLSLDFIYLAVPKI